MSDLTSQVEHLPKRYRLGFSADWPHPSQRTFYAALFLLEELHLAAHTAGPGLLALSREIDLFL